MKNKDCLPFAALAFVFLAACSTTAEGDGLSRQNRAAAARLAKLEPTGEVRSCLPTASRRNVQAVNNREFLISTGANKFYLSKTRGRCLGATRQNAIYQFNVRGVGFCSPLQVQILDQTTLTPIGFCVLGDFQALAPKETPDEE